MGIVFALTAGAAEAPKVASFSTALNWITKSREYQAVCLQTYANAWEKVAAAARKQKGPWTIVMDLDETVLDNSGYQRRLEARGPRAHTGGLGGLGCGTQSRARTGSQGVIAKVRKLPNGRIIFIGSYAQNTDHSRANVNQLGLGAKVTFTCYARIATTARISAAPRYCKAKAASSHMVRRRCWHGSATPHMIFLMIPSSSGGHTNLCFLIRSTAIGRTIETIKPFPAFFNKTSKPSEFTERLFWRGRLILPVMLLERVGDPPKGMEILMRGDKAGKN